MCSTFNLFNDYVKEKRVHIMILPDGTKKVVTHIGSIKLSDKIELKDVLYIPQFKYNLLSVGQLLQESQISVVFKTDCCYLQDLATQRVLGIAWKTDALYRINELSFKEELLRKSSISLNSTTVCNKPNIWHCRLGHVSTEVLAHISNIDVNCNATFCTICPVAKQCRFPFGNSSIKTDFPFQMLHMDLWGPYHLPSSTGAKYFLTVVDDNTRAVWTILLQQKHHTFNAIASFLKMVENQFNANVKTISTDNGTEFINSSCQDYFMEKGIQHQRSCPYSPQQNGTVERRHRQLLEVARALMFLASLPPKYWGEAIMMATSIMNVLPSKVLKWRSPHELLYKEEPKLNMFKVFGCQCFYKDNNPHKDKFQPRAHKAVFLGFSPGYKGWKMLDLVDQRMVISRDVQFQEDILPFKSTA